MILHTYCPSCGRPARLMTPAHITTLCACGVVLVEPRRPELEPAGIAVDQARIAVRALRRARQPVEGVQLDELLTMIERGLDVSVAARRSMEDMALLANESTAHGEATIEAWQHAARTQRHVRCCETDGCDMPASVEGPVCVACEAREAAPSIDEVDDAF